MANLDTGFKRASSVAINNYSVGPGFVFTTNGLTEAERQVAGYGYFGILAAAPSTAIVGLRRLRGVGS